MRFNNFVLYIPELYRVCENRVRATAQYTKADARVEILSLLGMTIFYCSRRCTPRHDVFAAIRCGSILAVAFLPLHSFANIVECFAFI